MTRPLPFRPEKTDLNIGFLPLTDAAVLVAAQERGIFEKYGLNVALQREISWANIRDRVAFGELDAAQMLAPMPLAATLGIDGLGIPMQTAFSMGLNGSAITLSAALNAEINGAGEDSTATPVRADGLQRLIAAQPQRRLVFAYVFPFSQHYYLLRAWLADSGIDPDQDVELRVIPPSQMVAQLAAGQIDGFCAGEPWNQLAVQRGIGQVVITSYEIWNNGPDKVLGVTRRWAEQYPQTHLALVASLLEAAQWLDKPSARRQLAEWLAQADYLNLPLQQLMAPLAGHYQYALPEPARYLPDFNVFFRYAATVPWPSFGRFFIDQMQRAGQLATDVVAEHWLHPETVYRMDIYRTVAAACGIAFPQTDEKPEGRHAAPWILHHASQPIAMGSSLVSVSCLQSYFASA